MIEGWIQIVMDTSLLFSIGALSFYDFNGLVWGKYRETVMK